MSSAVPLVPVVSFLVPALNEQANLPPLFERLLALEQALGQPAEIILIDDCSEDATFEVAQKAALAHPQIRPFSKPLPRGIGRGLRFALGCTRGRIGVVVMADGVDPLEHAVPEFCHKILDEGCQLVLLSRYTDTRDSDTIPFSYKLNHQLFRFFTSHALGIPHRDTTYAFRAFDLAFVRRLGLQSNGFEISPEITFKTFFSGGKIGEVSGRQTRRVSGKSKFVFSKAARGYLRVLVEGFRMRLGRRRLSPA